MSLEEQHESNLKESIEEEWFLKEITFKSEPDAPSKRVKVVTQNFNGSVTSAIASADADTTLDDVIGLVLSLQFVCIPQFEPSPLTLTLAQFACSRQHSAPTWPD